MAEPCPSAQSFLRYGGTIGDAERMILETGRALDECGAEKALAVAAYENTRAVLNGHKQQE